jgi:hypothetical protein
MCALAHCLLHLRYATLPPPCSRLFPLFRFLPLGLPSLPPSLLSHAPLSPRSPLSPLPSPLRVRRLNILYVQKQASVPKCGDCGTKLRGMKALRPNQLKNSITSKRQKHVTRAYGGARSLSPAPPLPPPSLSLARTLSLSDLSEVRAAC